MSERIKVLIIDDSALVRQMLTQMLSSDPQIEVVGTAPDAIMAQRKISQLHPQVLTLDIEMPGMDGLTFLDKLMRLKPMPVVMISTLTQKHAEATVRALELGAVDVVGKPTQDLSLHFDAMRNEIVDKVKQAATARLRSKSPLLRVPEPLQAPSSVVAKPAVTPAAPAAPSALKPPSVGARPGAISLIAIGASTGGVVALRELLGGLPVGLPPIVVVQHMPLGFTASFAARLDRTLPLAVFEATDGQTLSAGAVYIAPGDRQLRIARQGTGAFVARVSDDPAVGGHRPAVDVMFQSVAETIGASAVGVILTGMGRDGAVGLKAMRDAGSPTLGQDEASCVVYGMPKVAMEMGAVEVQLPPTRLAERIVRLAGGEV